jgi:hypothetical protein
VAWWGGVASFFKWLWQAYVLPPRIPYWIQRADFTSAEFPPVRFRRGLAALRSHDWAAERHFEQERAEAEGEEETCPPGIGFVYAEGCVLHVCPKGYGAQCFFVRKDDTLDLVYVSPDQQRRLLRLFYGGRHRRLASLFQSNLVEPAWAEWLRGGWTGIKIYAAIKAGFLLLIAGLVFAADIADGRPVLESLSRILSNLPFVLWMLAMMAAFTIPFVALLFAALALMEWTGRTVQIEGRDFTPNFTIGAFILLLLMGLAAWTGQWDKLPFHIAHIVCFFGAFVWPLLVMGRLRRQQDRLLEKIRAQYVIATTMLMAGETAQAHARLAFIRKLEAHWRLGAHPVMRYAHIAYAAITNFGIAFTGQLFHYHIQSTHNPSTFGDTVRFMFENPSVLWVTAGVALFFSLFALPDAIRVEGRAWSELYGDNLEAALKAGRGVERAEHHDIPPLPEGVTARELLGLAPGFTKAQLRAAWLRLARELHPDRWSAAGPAVRKMKEAALKRVNAARDELAPMAV